MQNTNTFQRVILNIAAVVAGVIVGIIAQTITTMIVGIIVSLPIIGTLLSYPIPPTVYIVFTANAIALFSGYSVCTKICVASNGKKYANGVFAVLMAIMFGIVAFTHPFPSASFFCYAVSAFGALLFIGSVGEEMQ